MATDGRWRRRGSDVQHADAVDGGVGSLRSHLRPPLIDKAFGVYCQAMSRIFFYGLFMDPSLLRGKGLHPTLVGPAELPGYQIHIGNRASLIPSPKSIVYGMLIDLPDEEATALYSAPDVSDYYPEKVNAVLLNGRTIRTSLCYNLPADKLGDGASAEYAEQLSALVLGLGFPPAYASEITSRGDA